MILQHIKLKKSKEKKCFILIYWPLVGLLSSTFIDISLLMFLGATVYFNFLFKVKSFLHIFFQIWSLVNSLFTGRLSPVIKYLLMHHHAV